MSHGTDPDGVPAPKPAEPGPAPSPHTPIAADDPTRTAPADTPGAGTGGGLPTFAVGAHLPDFELLSVLGRGGMGVVYKARQKSLDRLVAVKMLHDEPGRSDLALARFHIEARAAAGLDHPNIVRIHQIGECPLGHFFAMEYLEGQTLQDYLNQRPADKPVSVSAAVDLVIAVAEAVAHAHAKGVVHRDLKPGNVMIDKFKRPVVMDFGVAKVAGQGANLTAQGAVMGTPSYMPPEQTGEGPGEVGPHSDVYSLGAILYRLLTGRPPYEAETTIRTILLVISPEMPPPARRLRPEVPKELNAICMKCLNKKPVDRYPDAGALARELRAYRAGRAASVSGSHVVLPPVALVSAQTGRAVALSAPANVIGRASDCQVVLKSPEVSKRHCRVLVKGDRVEVEDLDSVNGTLVNGEAVQRAALKDGDVLEVGDHRFTVRLHRKAR